MMKRFFSVLFPEQDVPRENDVERVPLATCVVLLEAARADEHVSDFEREHILRVMQQRYKLSAEEAEDLLEEAKTVADESTDLWRFTNAINKAYSQEDKVQIMEEVWRIVLSDGELHGLEDHLAHKLRNLLNLNHPQTIEAKMKVLKEVRGE